MMDPLEELVKNLGTLMGIPLHLDKNRACCLDINHVLQVQLETDSTQQRLLMITFICDVPPGKFRESILKEALKANGIYPRVGTLSYSGRNNKLALFDYLPFEQLQAEKLASYLSTFIETADAWRVAIEQGSSSPMPSTPAKSSGLFDIL